MGVVLPLYQPWRVLEEIGMLDHLTAGRLEIGCASGVPQELIQVGMGPEESRDRFNETLQILDTWLAEPVSEKLEQEFNRPVICNQAAMIRDILHILGDWKPISGHSRVLSAA